MKTKWHWTPVKDKFMRDRYDSKIRGRVGELARRLGFPPGVVKRRAQQLGLAHPVANRKDWTPEETEFLMWNCGEKTSKWISNKLGRSETSVVLKCRRMQISRRVRGDGYTMRELELCFGTDHNVIGRWIKSGKLKATRRKTFKQHDPYDISDGAIMDFVREHPMEFRLDKVDQEWFMKLVLKRYFL